jgi:transposase-like protein
MAGENGRCPHCGSDRVVRAGTWKVVTKKRGLERVQRYECQTCHRFTSKPVGQLVPHKVYKVFDKVYKVYRV